MWKKLHIISPSIHIHINHINETAYMPVNIQAVILTFIQTSLIPYLNIQYIRLQLN